MWNKQQILAALKTQSQPLLQTELLEFSKKSHSQFTLKQLSAVEKQAKIYLSLPIPELTYSKFRLYWDTGDRESYESLYFERRGRLFVFSALTWLNPQNEEYKNALNEIIWAICSEPFWAMPAHFLGADDKALPFEEYPTQLDLFACETAFALAETLELNGQLLPEMVIKLVKLQIENRILNPFLQTDHKYRFENMKNNWSSVCASAIGGTALYLVDDTDTLAELLHRCFLCEEVYLSSFGNDGICTEGVDYWTYGFGFFVCFADLLNKRTNGSLNYFKEHKVQSIARSQQLFYISGKSTISFSDGSEDSHYRIGLSFYLQKHIDDVILPPQNFAAPILEDKCYRFCLALRDLLWEGQPLTTLNENFSAWLSNAQWFLSKKSSITLAAKAGNNGESHNHNDCGSFILYKNGVQVLCDLGAGLYDAEYFSPRRYDIFVNRSFSHNIPLIEGGEQQPGSEHNAEVLLREFGDTKNVFSCELKSCYENENLISFKRTLIHEINTDKVVVNDIFSFNRPGNITEVFCSREPIALQDDCAIIKRGDEKVVLNYDSSLFHANVIQQEYIDHYAQKQSAWLLRLETRSPQANNCCSIEIE
ncbi:heparinase II/III family protein [Clostridium sp. YIM B02515]|uniref:Heparinase II/III family protein n=1 Tax=Clostridium rhizosphaerae TaxID=2803861 RepID=A0ABS1TGV8_9CLOT|nr:heparinase II/III family protein [Clostridium rhizosphaerae]MBL4937163.1 heparinase II/III family protein [Clostridium rhizosphaerae]